MRILLCCNAGMSSSILVKKMMEVTKDFDEEFEIKAVAGSGIKNELGKWDVCLLGPQLSYALDAIKKQLNIPVAVIEPRIYAMADGIKAINLAKEVINNEKF